MQADGFPARCHTLNDRIELDVANAQAFEKVVHLQRL
jgi:hypothetical protein